MRTCLPTMCRDGMGGCGGLTWDVYCDTPDRILCDSYLAERDDEHQIVTLRQRRRRQQDSGGITGNPDRAGRELPKPTDLRIPEEAYSVNRRLLLMPSGQAYLLMFFQIWRRRQSEGVLTKEGEPITDEYILAQWRKVAGVKKNAAKQHAEPQSATEHQGGASVVQATLR